MSKVKECSHTYTDNEKMYRSDQSFYWSENITAEIEDGKMSVHIGGTDYYASGDVIPINFCPFCGISVELIPKKKEE